MQRWWWWCGRVGNTAHFDLSLFAVSAAYVCKNSSVGCRSAMDSDISGSNLWEEHHRCVTRDPHPRQHPALMSARTLRRISRSLASGSGFARPVPCACRRGYSPNARSPTQTHTCARQRVHPLHGERGQQTARAYHGANSSCPFHVYNLQVQHVRQIANAGITVARHMVRSRGVRQQGGQGSARSYPSCWHQ